MVAVPVVAWLLPQSWRAWGISFVGFTFLAFSAPLSLVLLALLALAGWMIARRTRHRAWPVTSLAVLVAGTLACFKWGYRVGEGSEQFVVPLGLSFYALRILHFWLETYTGAIQCPEFGSYARYLSDGGSGWESNPPLRGSARSRTALKAAQVTRPESLPTR